MLPVVGAKHAFAAEASPSPSPDDTGMTAQLARYIVAARDQPLPDAVLVECKNHILDTFGAMVSGSRMRPGMLATQYVRTLGGAPQASVVGSDLRTSTVNAALANAMRAHSDETDDFEPVTKAHPGCSTVPAALALGEAQGASGAALVRAVALGCDTAGRLLMALGPDLVRASQRRRHGLDVRRAWRGRGAHAARRTPDALCDLVRGATGIGAMELGEGSRP
ncbi:MmgE/PrpD family protein [Paraburkholderia sp. CNPSo 3076]|uniref:MmgE/PrpD family protein n=1 Tax=Paraburkholderia sp. CNPSo 3076 TaxID=2940936 RepID=UPI0022567EE1|nr:MmgE/PrpD family protein [Paraburkholderia sp. CNPSo 3076]MCX5542453.1 MmgE/PrpD family protein [Paraburkholderia sp. CNPSo 3076]